MYDLPSEDPEEPGLPDIFHDLQPQLLSATLQLKAYAQSEIFTGTDLNLYYDVHHPLWHKRPDWFLALGVPRLYDGVDLRASYVVWQEGVNPFVVVELLSPGTEKEDLEPFAGTEPSLEDLTDADQSSEADFSDRRTGATAESGNGQTGKASPPSKWQVYEQILRVPYYLVFSRYTNRLRCFQLTGGHYQEQLLAADDPRVWIPELELGLGLWQGEYDGINRLWLRWYDAAGNWVPTEAEQARLEVEQLRLENARLAERLRQLGIDPEEI
ncbi:Uma2 family endonuclease [Leptolyngbya sp. NK1-12]|uniref:Uma2 family endonuclease n=2 Tax=Leptolyngbya sp. NK1-12 TaxID=2547451 RepID=A0AA96WJT3_9CYAN|nr:Uma2 family endonuclease [Leptolyngbya sp. NK1-12]